MSDFQVPVAVNEPVLNYEPGSPERETLKAEIDRMSSEQIEIPLIIGGKEVRTGDMATQVMPHNHGHVLATSHRAGKEEVKQAIEAAAQAHNDWSRWPLHERAAVFLRAAELLATTWRQVANASTMLNQSKTAHQAEIDAACELIDGHVAVDAHLEHYAWLLREPSIYSLIETTLVDAAHRRGELALAVGDVERANWAAQKGLDIVEGQEAMYRMMMEAAAKAGDRSEEHTSELQSH